MPEPPLHESIANEYWPDNMVSPVLFQRALSAAVNGGNGLPDLIVEVGPHHALKGPALQTLSSTNPLASSIPYLGLLTRGEDGIETMANAIGSFWSFLSPGSTDAAQYAALFRPHRPPHFLKDLPVYPFDRSQVYWYETRLARFYLKDWNKPHPLLGSLTTDCAQAVPLAQLSSPE